MNRARRRSARTRLLWAIGALVVVLAVSTVAFGLAVVRPLAQGRPIVMPVMGFDLTVMVETRSPSRRFVVGLNHRAKAEPSVGPGTRPSS